MLLLFLTDGVDDTVPVVGIYYVSRVMTCSLTYISAVTSQKLPLTTRTNIYGHPAANVYNNWTRVTLLQCR